MWSVCIFNVTFVIRAKVDSSSQLSTVQAFTSFAIISLITSPAVQLLASIPAVTAALGSFDRIHKFLISPSAPDRSHTDDVNGESSISTDNDRLSHEMRRSLEMYQIRNYIKPSTKSEEITLVMSGARIRPASDASFCLQDVNLSVKVGTMIVITGPVGCGKTTLLKGILGEIPCEQGSVTKTSSGTAYCSQTPWLQNITILDIVCGAPELDPAWYRQVIRGCALEYDLSQMRDGDKSVVGSRELTLSGGQNQRLVSFPC